MTAQETRTPQPWTLPTNLPGYYERCANPECGHFAIWHGTLCETQEIVCENGCQCKKFVMDAEEHARQIAVGFREPTS